MNKSHLFYLKNKPKQKIIYDFKRKKEKSYKKEFICNKSKKRIKLDDSKWIPVT